MLSSEDVIRTPIKLRESIYIDVCDCINSHRVYVDGELRYIIGELFSIEELKEFLKTTIYCVNILLTTKDIDWKEKVDICLENNVPITLQTSEVIGSNLLKKISEVFHCSIHVSIELPTKNPGNYIGCKFWEDEKMQSFRKLLITCKAWKIDCAVCINVDSRKNSIYDLYEILEYLKPGLNHVFLKCQGRENIESISQYCKNRKIKIENVTEIPLQLENGAYRYASSGMCKMPLGMPQFLYKRDELSGLFLESEYPKEGYICPHCGGLILNSKKKEHL